MWRNGPQMFFAFGDTAAAPIVGQSPRASRYRYAYNVAQATRVSVVLLGILWGM